MRKGLLGYEALIKVISEYSFETVLDIGSGEGLHADYFERHNKKVTRVDLGDSIYFKKKPKQTIIKGNYLDIKFENQFDLIWVCHVLEHQLNVNFFLKKIKQDLKPNGVLCITVPPLKDRIVGGHLSLWNAGLLLYNLVLAGFNCEGARAKKYGYNISVILKNSDVELPNLEYDHGDINKLKHFFPKPLYNYSEDMKEGFMGNIKYLNW